MLQSHKTTHYAVVLGLRRRQQLTVPVINKAGFTAVDESKPGG
jgi:hypothetical protein